MGNNYKLKFEVAGIGPAIRTFDQMNKRLLELENTKAFWEAYKGAEKLEKGIKSLDNTSRRRAKNSKTDSDTVSRANKKVSDSESQVEKATTRRTKATKAATTAANEAAKASDKTVAANKRNAKSEKEVDAASTTRARNAKVTQKAIADAAGKAEQSAARANKANKALAEGSKAAMNDLRDALKNVDYKLILRDMDKLTKGGKLTQGEMKRLERQILNYSAALKQVTSPEHRAAYRDLFGSNVAADMRKVEGYQTRVTEALRAHQIQVERTARAEKSYRDGTLKGRGAQADMTYTTALKGLKGSSTATSANEKALKNSLSHLQKIQTAYNNIQKQTDSIAKARMQQDFIGAYGSRAFNSAKSGRLEDHLTSGRKNLVSVNRNLENQRRRSEELASATAKLGSVAKNVKFQQFKQDLKDLAGSTEFTTAALNRQRKVIEAWKAAAAKAASGTPADRKAFGQNYGTSAQAQVKSLVKELDQALVNVEAKLAQNRRAQSTGDAARNAKSEAAYLKNVENGNRAFRERQNLLKDQIKFGNLNVNQLKAESEYLAKAVSQYRSIQKFKGQPSYAGLMRDFEGKYGSYAGGAIDSGSIRRQTRAINARVQELDGAKSRKDSEAQAAAAARSARETIKMAVAADQADRKYASIVQRLGSKTLMERTSNGQLKNDIQSLDTMITKMAHINQLGKKNSAYSTLKNDFVQTHGKQAWNAGQKGLSASRDALNSVATERLNAALGRTKQLSDNIHQVWRGMAAASGNIWLSWGNFLPMLAGLAAAGSVFQSLSIDRKLGWQMEMVGVAADTGSENVKELRDRVTELGTSGIIQGPLQLASALRVLTQAGMKTEEAFASLKTVTNLALVAEISDDQAAKFMAGARSAFNLDKTVVGEDGVERKELDSNKFREAADQTAKAAAVSQTSIERMMEALRQASSEAEKYNLTIADTSTVLAVLARYNIEGSTAGTSLRNFLVDLTGRTPKAKKALQDLGITIYNAQGEVKPFTEIVGDLQGKLGDLSSKEKQEWLRKIFNERGMKTANVLLSLTNAELMDLHNQISRSSENMGYTEASAQRLAKTTEGAFRRMKNGWEGMMGVVGGNLEDPFKNFLGKLTELSRDRSIQAGIESLGKAFLMIGSIGTTAVGTLAEFSSVLVSAGVAATAYGLILKRGVIVKLYEYIATQTAAAVASVRTAATFTASARAMAAAAWPLALAAGLGVLTYSLIHVDTSAKSATQSLQEMDQTLGTVSVDLYEAFNKLSGSGGKVDVKLGIGIDGDRMAELGNKAVTQQMRLAKNAEEFGENQKKIHRAVAEAAKENTALTTTAYGQMFDSVGLDSSNLTKSQLEQAIMLRDRKGSLLKDELMKFDSHFSGVEKLADEERKVRMGFEQDIYNNAVELMTLRTQLVKAQLQEIREAAANEMGTVEILMKSVIPFGENSDLANQAEELDRYTRLRKNPASAERFKPKYLTKEQLEKGAKIIEQDHSGRNDLEKAASAAAKSGPTLSKREFDPSQMVRSYLADSNKELKSYKEKLASDPGKMLPMAALQLESLKAYAEITKGRDPAGSEAASAEKAYQGILGVYNEAVQVNKKSEQEAATTVKVAPGGGSTVGDGDSGGDYTAPNVTTETKYSAGYASKFDEYARKYAEEKTARLKKDFDRQKAIFGTTTAEAAQDYLKALDEETNAIQAEKLTDVLKTVDELRASIANGEFVGDSLVQAHKDLKNMSQLAMDLQAKGVVQLGKLVREDITTTQDMTKLDVGSNIPPSSVNGRQVGGPVKMSGGARYSMPFNGNFRISSGIGHRGSPGGVGSTDHKGTDYAMPVGTPVYAQADGVATTGKQFTKKKNGKIGGAGNYINVNTDEGYKTGSFHLSKFAVKSGQRVKAGDLIGYSGNTGGSTGPHLHQQVQDPQGRLLQADEFGKGNIVYAGGGKGGKVKVKPKGKKGQVESVTSEQTFTGVNETDGKLYVQQKKDAAEIAAQELAKLKATWELNGLLVEQEEKKIVWKASALQLDAQKHESASQELDLMKSSGFISDRAYTRAMDTLQLQDLEMQKKRQLLEIDAENGLTAEERLALEGKVSFEYQNQLILLEKQKAARDFSDTAEGGLQRGLADLANQAVSWGDVTAMAVTSTFSGLSDSLGELFTTGSTSFRDMTVSILSDLSKLLIKMALVAAIKAALEGMSGSSTGWVAQLGKMGMSAFNATGGAYGDGVKYFANGGTFTNSIVSSATMFKSGGMLGVMGEAGPEAILPLTRTSSGNLGVETTGMGGGGGGVNAPVTVIVNVNSDGSSDEQSQTDSAAQGRQLGNMITAKVKDVIGQEMRPGGSIYNMTKR